MEETKSTDTEKLVDFFEKGAKFEILKGREAYFRAWDHQLIQEAYPFTVKAPGEAKSQWDILDLCPAVPAADKPREVVSPPRAQKPCSQSLPSGAEDARAPAHRNSAV